VKFISINNSTNIPLPLGLNNLHSKEKTIFVGIGSSYWAPRFAEILWREYSIQIVDVTYVQSYDFVITNQCVIVTNEIVVVFSHCGTKTFRVNPLEFAKRSGVTTVTGIASPNHSSADIRIEKCAQETCGTITISLRSVIARIIK
jgi:fructoselysine-6-P-deglycase FrlB-like protein